MAFDNNVRNTTQSHIDEFSFDRDALNQTKEEILDRSISGPLKHTDITVDLNDTMNQSMKISRN